MRQRPVLQLASVGLSLLALSSVPSVARQPEPVQKRSCELSKELAGISGHVLLRYTVNEAGRVNFIEPVFAVAKPPEREKDIVHEVEECVKTWSYAAARSKAEPTVAGRPTGSLELLQAFHYFGPGGSDGEKVDLEDGKKALKRHIEELRSQKLALAKGLLAGPRLFETSGGGWVMQTNVRPKEREEIVKGVSFAMEAFGGVFTGARPLPESSRLTLLVFGAEDQFNQVAAFDNLFRGPKPAGQYSSADEMAYTFASGMDHPLRHSVDYVVHETVHHLVYQRLAIPGRHPPFWVNEGIATFVELLKPDKKGEFDRFKFRRGRQAQGAFTWVSKADGYLDAFQRDVKSGSGLDFEEFLRGRFKDVNAEQAYGRSWILTHYLINGDGGALMKPFQDWLTGAMGTDGDGGISAALGRTPEQILSAMAAHVAAMKRGG